MFTRNRLCVVLSVVAFAALIATCAQATPITVVNHSFEIPTLADGGASDANAYGWGGYFPSTGGTILWNPPESIFTGAAGNGTPAGADGANIATLYTGTTSGSYAVLQQKTGAPWAANTVYTLTVAIGDRKDFAAVPITIGFIDAATSTWLSSVTVQPAELTNDAFVDKSVTFSSPTAGGEGHILTINFIADADGVGSAIALDNVRLDATVVPEPGTLALLSAGLFGLLCYAWRKRK